MVEELAQTVSRERSHRAGLTVRCSQTRRQSSTTFS